MIKSQAAVAKKWCRFRTFPYRWGTCGRPQGTDGYRPNLKRSLSLLLCWKATVFCGLSTPTYYRCMYSHYERGTWQILAPMSVEYLLPYQLLRDYRDFLTLEEVKYNKSGPMFDFGRQNEPSRYHLPHVPFFKRFLQALHCL
jgi:hypothetical protein